MCKEKYGSFYSFNYDFFSELEQWILANNKPLNDVK